MIKRLRIFAGPNGSGKTTLKNQILLILCSCFLLNSCQMKNPEEAKKYALDLIDDKKYVLNDIRKQLETVDSVNKVITITVEKPGSDKLFPNCETCISSLSMTSRNIVAGDINNLGLSYVNFLKTKYIDFGLGFRNKFYNYYFIREYIDINDTSAYTKPNYKCYYLKDNWVLYSNQKERP